MKKTTTSECELVKLKERNYIRLAYIDPRNVHILFGCACEAS